VDGYGTVTTVAAVASGDGAPYQRRLTGHLVANSEVACRDEAQLLS
jgi:hypothetical protein